MTDKRPDPKPRKYPELWQSYLIWREIMEQRKRHNLRISSAEKGKSNLNPHIEEMFLAIMDLDNKLNIFRKQMIEYAEDTGDIWKWTTGIKGLKQGGLAAQLIAQVDDIAKFDTVSKLWRHAGQGVVKGEAEHSQKGRKDRFSRTLKSTVWQIGEQFIRQQTPTYSDIYYAEKDRQMDLHPDPICKKCGKIVERPKNPTSPHVCECGATSRMFEIRYTPAHLHNIAKRKAVKIFLQHFWQKWREFEGLPIGQPYVQAKLGHEHIIPPPEVSDE